ncbi:MAG: C25 family cysteine peptidase [Planctomycetota bacterium]|jgi:hypothetical protein
MMHSKFIFCLVLGLILFPLASLVQGDSFQGSISLSQENLSIEASRGFDVIHFENCGYTDKVGGPSLPTRQVNVAIPAGSEVIDVRIIDIHYTALGGGFDIMPLTEPIHCSAAPPENPFQKDPAVYERNEEFPGQIAVQRGDWDYYGQGYATLEFFPVQYNPVTGQVRVAERIDFELIYDRPASPSTKTYNLSEKNRRYINMRQRNMAINPEAVGELASFEPPLAAALDPGDYEYVIITSSSFVSAFQPLADWRTQMGMPAKIVTTNWVYSNYPTGTNQERVKAFMVDANATWGTLFFLMGGEGAYVPYMTTNVDGTNIPNDTKYSDHDNNWACDLFVGRACVNNTTQVDTFVNKVLTYEKNPPANYGNKAFFMGFDLDGSTDGEDCKIKIDNDYLPAYMTLVTEYDSEGGAHEGDVKTYLNQGQNLVNHVDHGETKRVGVGSQHGGWLSSTEAQNFTNGNKWSNFVTLSCYSGNFPNACWGELFCRDDQGGITFTGNSRYGWYSPGNTNAMSFKYEQKWWEALFVEGAYRVGETLGISKNNFFPFNATYKYIFTELNLFGDPALHLWTKNPVNLTVSHPSSINTGTQNFTVNVKYVTTPIENALVCAMKGTDVYAYGTTDAAGNAVLSIDPATTGTMTVTVTAQNYKYYEGSVTVNQGSGAPLIVAINPRCGPEAGSTTITVQGGNFTTSPLMTVKIGSSNCTNVIVVDSTTLTCVTPAGTNGWHNVEVSNSYGSGTLPAAWRYYPVTTNPFNGTDVNVANLTTPADVVMIISGNPLTSYYAFFSFGGGPTPTPYGNMGLDSPFYFLFSGVIPGSGHLLIPMPIGAGYGPLDFYIHVLGLNGSSQAVWAYGGGNPNGTGSIWFHLLN